MAKAKLVKRKRRIKIEGIATLLLTLSIFMYLGAKLGLQSYNILLNKQAETIEEKASTLKDAVANLENEVSTLESRDHLLGMVESEGIKLNQENVVNIKDDSSK